MGLNSLYLNKIDINRNNQKLIGGVYTRDSITNKRVNKNMKDIVEVISEYISLKKFDRNYFYVCLFHCEGKGALHVDPQDNVDIFLQQHKTLLKKL